jgi:hypothetical protein
MGRSAKLTPHQNHDALKARAAGSAAGLLHNDNFTPRLVERYRLPQEIRREVLRWLWLLDNDDPYVWPLCLFMSIVPHLGEAIDWIKCVLTIKLI